mgnify:FL=1
MPERNDFDKQPDKETKVRVQNTEVRIEVGPIFGSAKKAGQSTEDMKTISNDWFRQNGGI